MPTKNVAKFTKARQLFVSFGILFVCFVAIVVTEAQSPDQPLPRFRAGANLVTVDAYFTKDGAAVSDLKAEEIEIVEDDRPQTVESFRLVRATGQGASSARSNPIGVAAERAAAEANDARIFAVFFDHWHVQFDGSSKAAAPLSTFLHRVTGAGDLVGVMTPDMPARTMSLVHRTEGIERAVRETLNWGQRDRVNTPDPREREIQLCYPDNDRTRPQFRGVAKEMIERRREQKTLRALDDLIAHLSGLQDRRKFVVLLSEGWVQFRQNERLGAILEPDSIPAAPGVGVVDGRVTAGGNRPNAYDRSFESCERERAMLAFVDHEVEIRQLAQRANRANVTFYAVDPRGLAAFDDPIGPMRPATPVQDVQRMASRQGGLRELAGNTDGAVVLNTNDVKGGVARMMADLSAYYVMQYYSTNPKLDGRFRAITVRVKRPGVRVRARPGYLAPTEAEARAAGVPSKPAALPAGVEAMERRLPVTALRRGPSTGLAYARATESRFRRTERLRIEVPAPQDAANLAGRLLSAQGQPLQVIVTTSTEQTTSGTIAIADLSLAPLAVGEYKLELSFETAGATSSASYRFRIVP